MREKCQFVTITVRNMVFFKLLFWPFDNHSLNLFFILSYLSSSLPLLVSVFIFNPFFNHFYRPTHPTVPTLSLCLPMLPYMISTISMFFPTMRTPTLLSLLFSSRPFTRYQEQDLLVVNFGLLRAISTILMIPTIPMISLPPPELLYDLSQCSLRPREHLTNSLEIANSLLQHLNLKSYWWLHHWDYPPWPPEGSRCQILCVGRKVSGPLFPFSS